MKKWWGVALCLGICLAIAAPARGQSQITTGVIQGTVLDASGASVPGASVVVTNLDTNLESTATTGTDGRFAFLQLPPGRYTLKVSKQGFTTVVQENMALTVGQTIPLTLTLKISPGMQQVVVTAIPVVDTTNTANASTLSPITVSTTPVLGRKFEDLFTLTPGVSVVQGPDGDEITFNGQRGIFNNISLDGGDYNNGFFGEQLGGQRPSIDITLDAVQEFQVVANSATAEFGRTAGGVINVITKSGTNDLHGGIFYFQRKQELTSHTSDHKTLTNFSREQFGATAGGPIIKSKMFFFGAVEQIIENLQRPNLSEQLGPTPCPIAAPVVPGNEALINGNSDCKRLALINFFQTNRNQQEGLPVGHLKHNSNALGKYDWNITPGNRLSASYNFDRSKNLNDTFDVATYGDSANGIEGNPAHIQAFNANGFSSISATKLNEAHFTYSRETRPRSAVKSNVPADTGMDFVTPFRFGNPFFLEPTIDELLWRTQVKDNFSIISGRHTIKFGGEWLHTRNDQVFRGFFTGRYIFDSVVGFLHYALPASTGPGFGPTTRECSDGSFVTPPSTCPAGTTATGGPLLFYLQDGVPTGLTNIPPGASKISNENYTLFVQDKWQVWPNFTLNYGLRWEAQIFPEDVFPPSQTAFAIFLNNPAFPSDGTEHNAKKMFQPRIGFAWDVRNNSKSVLRASWGIFNASQNMLSQVGSITTNGVQQHTIFSDSAFGGGPTWPNAFTPTAGNPPCTLGTPTNPFPCFTGVRVFSKDYANPRIYTTDVAFEQEVARDWALYTDFSWLKGVHLTRFINANVGNAPVVCCAISNVVQVFLPGTGDSVFYSGASPFGPQLGDVFVAESVGKSLYRGWTIGVRKRFSRHFQLEGNYVLSWDRDDDSNERDPFTDRSFNRFDLRRDYALADRDERHKFNFFSYAELPAGFQADIRFQAHSAQPVTDNTLGTGTGAPCSPDNSVFRVVNGVDCGRNHLRKNNKFISLDWRLVRPFKFGDRYQLVPMIEMFNTFNNDNNIAQSAAPVLFNFDGFLRQGIGDPRQVQLALKFKF